MLPIRFVQVRHKSGVFSDKRTKKSPLQGSFYTLQGICAIRKLFSGPVDVVRVLAAVDAAAVPDRVGGQIFGPGMVARGIEVDAVLVA